MGFFKKEVAKEIRFTDPKDIKINETLNLVFDAMKEKGYDPYKQITYYLYSEDEKYVTTYNNARTALLELDRDDIMRHMLLDYFKK